MKVTFIIALFLLPISSFAFSGIFPADALTVHHEFLIDSDFVLVATSTFTVLAVSAGFKDGSQTDLFMYCGTPNETNEVHETHGNDLYQDLMSYVCKDNPLIIRAENVSPQNAHYLVTYVPYNMASTSTTTIQATLTNPYNGANFKEWLFVSSVGLFFLSFIFWRSASNRFNFSKKYQ